MTTKKVARKDKAYGVYSELGDGLCIEFFADEDSAYTYRKTLANRYQMPKETYEDALARYKVVKVVIHYHV